MSYGRELYKRLTQNRINWDAAFVILAAAAAPLWSIWMLKIVGGVACVAVLLLGAVNLRHELKEWDRHKFPNTGEDKELVPFLSTYPDDWKVWSVVLPIVTIAIYWLFLSATKG